jgi:hypothetical protein
MKFSITAILIALLIFSANSISHADQCGVITDWTQADAEAILTPLDDWWGVGGPYSDPDYATLVLSGIWTVREDYKWRRSVLVFSFADAAAAQAKFDEIKAENRADPHPRSIIMDDTRTLFSIVPGWTITGAEGDRATDFRLTELYRETFVIYISGWSLVFNDYEGILMTTLRGNFLSLAGRAHGIIDEKCGWKSCPPRITLYPYTPGTFLFELNILKDKGFLIEIDDDDGVIDSAGNWKIDWSTLQVLVNGHDITGHFLSTLVDQGLLNKASVLENNTLFQALIRLDPEKLMTTHNLFAVAENGWATITLAICDHHGLCTSKEHQVYFGPFSLFEEARRESFPVGGRILLENIREGNTGKKCQTEVFFAIWNESSGKFWFRHLFDLQADSQYVWSLYQNQSDFKIYTTSAPNAGHYYAASRVALVYDDWSKFGPGNLYLYVGNLDTSTNEWAIDYGPILDP